MAVLDLNHSNAIAGNGVIAKFVADIRETLARRALFRQTISELRELSDRELADLGVSRSSIRSIAYDAAYGAK